MDGLEECGKLSVGGIMKEFEEATVDKAVEMYLRTYNKPESIVGDVVRVLLNRSSRVGEVKQIIPEMFI